MSKTKSLLTVAMVAVMLAAGAGSAAFDQPQHPGAGPAAFDQPPSIVGGTAVPLGKYAFMAAILDKGRGGNEVNQHFCGGTLIDSDSVLTAAHCVDRFGSGSIWITKKDVSNMRVVVGLTRLTLSFKPPLGKTNGQVRGVSGIFISNNWDDRDPNSTSPKDRRWDVAVLKLSGPVTGIAPVRIPPRPRIRTRRQAK